MMIEAYKKMFSNYANFKDRTTRKDYWLCVLMNAIIGFVMGFISGITDVKAISYIAYIYFLVILIPGIAMVVRRLHDVNKSGWWYFIIVVPVIGMIWLLVLECTASVTENNNYGKQL